MSSHAHHAARCGCCTKSSCGFLSRRSFLGAVSVAAAGPVLGGVSAAFAEGDFAEHIDTASFPPKPEVRVKGAFIRLKPPYWLGWPGASLDVEESRRQFVMQIAQSAERAEVHVAFDTQPIESEEALQSFIAAIEEEPPSAVLLALEHVGAWGWVNRVAESGIQTIVIASPEVARSKRAAEIAQRHGAHITSSLDSEALHRAFRSVRALFLTDRPTTGNDGTSS